MLHVTGISGAMRNRKSDKTDKTMSLKGQQGKQWSYNTTQKKTKE
jgi:hypothetical protein